MAVPLKARKEITKTLQNMKIIGPLIHHISVFLIPLTSILCFLIRCHRLR
jgi:hypothetical protein